MNIEEFQERLFPIDYVKELVNKYQSKEISIGKLCEVLEERIQSNPSEFGMVKKEEMHITELIEEASELMQKLLPAEQFGEDYDCERLHEIIMSFASVQHQADQLAEALREAEGWIKVEDRTPIAYKTGNYDGKQSDLVLTYDAKRDVYEISCLYEGTLDGSKFKSWYDGNDFETSPPTHWKPLKSPLEQTALTNYEQGKETFYGCENGNHDVIPTLGYENSVTGEECRVCGKKL